MESSHLHLRSANQKRLGNNVFTVKLGFKPGLLTTEKEVPEVLLYHMMPPKKKGHKQLSREQAYTSVAYGLIDHWTFQNVYTLTSKNIIKKI